MEYQETLSVAEAGAALGVSPRTARRWCKEGKLPAKKSGKSYLIGMDAVEQMRLSLKEKNALVQKQEAVPDAPCFSGDGQTTEAIGEADTTSNAAVNPVARDGGDVAGNGQLAGQVEKLQARVDRISQIVADRMKSLEKGNKKLSARADNLKDGLGVMAVALAGVTLILALVFVGHHTQEESGACP